VTKSSFVLQDSFLENVTAAREYFFSPPTRFCLIPSFPQLPLLLLRGLSGLLTPGAVFSGSSLHVSRVTLKNISCFGHCFRSKTDVLVEDSLFDDFSICMGGGKKGGGRKEGGGRFKEVEEVGGG
jgi:hypothetical protein